MIMSKRFTLSIKNNKGLCVFDTATGKSYWYACNLCSLLNELQEEVEQLQSICKRTEEEKEHYADLYNTIKR